jgi:putative polyketide hydroxylase
VLFRAQLDHYLESGINQFVLDQPDLKGMLTTYQDGRWLLMFSDDQERDEATLKAKVIQAIGRSDVAFELMTTGCWVLSALIADRFADRRVFLAGDAAHTLPPARGGYGANTGIEDAFNLAWKLKKVLKGTSAPALLETYDEERRPIAWLRHDQIFARPDYEKWATETEKQTKILDDDAMELGQLYRSKAVIGAGKDLPPAMRPEQWAGQPGTRVPHLWVCVDGQPCSTLDLLQREWQLITEEESWVAVVQKIRDQFSCSLACILVGTKGSTDPTVISCTLVNSTIDSDGYDGSLTSFGQAFGVGTTGATLVRPDGYVAWRSLEAPVDAVGTLRSVFAEVAALKKHQPSEVLLVPTSPVSRDG